MRVLPTALAALLLIAPAAHAATIPVTTTTDELTFDATCSLREAMYAANWDTTGNYGCVAGDGADTIELEPETYTLSIAGRNEQSGETGDLNVLNDELIIEGNGATIDAAGVDRAIGSFAPLALRDLTITGGDPGAAATGWGADGGGLYALAALTAERVLFVDNQGGDGDDPGDPGGSGGGLVSLGELVVVDSVFAGNRAGHGAEAPVGDYGGAGGIGGGLAVYGDGPATVDGTYFEGNAGGNGGDQGPGAFAGDGGRGAAMAIGTEDSLVVNSVITGNVLGAGGEGQDQNLAHGAISTFAAVELRHLTVTGNTAPDAGSTAGVYGEPESFPPVLAASVVTDGCAGTIVDAADNFTAPGTDCPGEAVDPRLGDDLVPGAASPLVDAVGGACPEIDFRGVARPQGPACDAGAFERRLPVFTVSREAIPFALVPLATTSAPEQVGLSYSGEEPAVVGPVTTTGPFSASGCSGIALADGESCTIDARFTPSTLGPVTGALSVEGESVRLTGRGVPNAPAVTTTRLRFRKVYSPRRKGRKVRLRVRLSCGQPAPACAETLVARVRRRGRRPARAKREIVLPAGQIRVFTLRVKPARRLRRAKRVVIRLALSRDGLPTTEMRVRKKLLR